ncbi:MAG: polysaccharide deacetylase family protein [Clostridia bacterium]|nr:polysaccharide deacetylase family protein [Clostridia bacterium]
MKMRLKDGKTKVLTLSYDDGVVQDIRLSEILNRHGIKCTFNINSGTYLAEDKVREVFRGRLKRSEAIALFADSGHEVAVHAYTHPFLDRLDCTEILYEITEDRRDIESTYGTIARGMAYPYGTYNASVIDVLKHCGIVYSRTVKSTEKFGFPENWLELHPTCHHNNPRLMELAKRFVEVPSKYGNAEMFYLWGHSFEFDTNDNWDVIERFAEYAGGHEHIWYATNIEIYDYVKAYEALQTSYDKRTVHNPSAIDVWFEHRGKMYCVKAGETLKL